MVKRRIFFLCIAAAMSSIQPAFSKCAEDKTYGQICDTVFQPDWWVGSWASEETDQCGNDLVTFIYLTRKHTFHKHLVSSDHSMRDIWGTYQVTLSSPEQKNGKEYVPLRQTEMKYVNERLKTTARYDLDALYFRRHSQRNKAVSDSYPRSGLTDTLYGKIVFQIEGHLPENYAVGGSQTYSFKTQGLGYIQISGPGVDEGLMRKYSNNIIGYPKNNLASNRYNIKGRYEAKNKYCSQDRR